MSALFKLEPEEEIIKVTKPHSASFLSSPMFLVGGLLVFLGTPKWLLTAHVFVRILFVGAGLLLIGISYLRRVSAYTFYFTNRRVVSHFSFIRKAYREIWYDKLIEVKATCWGQKLAGQELKKERCDQPPQVCSSKGGGHLHPMNPLEREKETDNAD